MMMDPNRCLRYSTSKMWLGGAGVSLIFVAIALLMYLSPRASHPGDRVMAVICGAFFGLCGLGYVYFAIRERRHPLITLTPVGLQTREMGSKQREVSWAEVTALGIWRGERWSKNRVPEHYLIALGRPGARVGTTEDMVTEGWDELDEPANLDGREEAGAMETGMPPWLIMLPLRQLFATRSTKRMERECAALLEEIAETFAPELDLYKITVEREIQPLNMTGDDG